MGLVGQPATVQPHEYALQYQGEPPPIPGQLCHAPLPKCDLCSRINGGQLLVTSPALAARFRDLRPKNLSNTERLDQDWADALFFNQSRFDYLLRNLSASQSGDKGSYATCALPQQFYARCWANRAFVGGYVGPQKGAVRASLAFNCSRRATYHMNCVPSRKEKQKEMWSVAKQWSSRCGNRTAYE